MPNPSPASNRGVITLIVVGIVFLFLFILGRKCFISVPAGHVAVASLFGKVKAEAYPEGMHFPVNPLYSWTEFDAREKSHKESASVPSQDQLNTEIDVSVQYRLNRDMAAQILRDTGTEEQVVEVHLVPKLRSVVREQGKSVKKAEEFFLETTQQTLQTKIFEELREYLQPKGITVEAVLLRDIKLPQAILLNVERKKQAEQEVERQKAELERQKIEAQQQVVTATAQREAAEQEAMRKKVLADAQAYEIQKINEAIANNPAYIQLQALKTLTDISQDPASKMYFMDGNSTMPLPLLHMGDVTGDNKLVPKK